MTEVERRGALMLVHGGWHGSWCWEHLIPELDEGWTVSTVDLPSVNGDPNVSMYDDAQAIRDHLDGIDGPVTVLAHSYAGIPVSEIAGTAPNVTRLIYLAAHMLEVGESAASALPGEPSDPPEPPDLWPVFGNAREVFYFDVRADWADEAVTRLQPQSRRVLYDRQTRAAWQTIPSALVLCDEDQVIPEFFQKQGEGVANLVRHLPGGHSPFLSRPRELADLINEIAQDLPGRTG
ncbi:hypothetical protein Pth03_46660 [Planotetraspora thailandica]|uniref:AB hydrolase-1 domain-containing protein n=1 Tax=Planotetraspora thailandica TaxID=487172 RepID=A0A8J3V651_9ACTN|nr:alpha/beta hydrolase [Planotetraspora thailandica]GII56277.1 hypothetical protein Pth03_46660 [Planotetraspora thailandica]